MGHAIDYLRIKDCKSAKAEIERAADEFYAGNHDWYESPGTTMPYPIKYYDQVFDTKREAAQFIQDRDYDYAQIAVRYRDFSKVKPPAKIIKAREAVKKAEDEYRKAAYKFHFENHKATFIGCPHCASKISREYMRTNACPVCKHDMRPKSTLDAIAAKRKKVEELEEKLAGMERDWQKSRTNKGEIYWLVKVECHC